MKHAEYVRAVAAMLIVLVMISQSVQANNSVVGV
jgi:hypothetical protein